MSSTEQSQTVAPVAPVAEVPAPAGEQEESMDTTTAAQTDLESKSTSSAPVQTPQKPQPTANVPHIEPQKAETAKVFQPAQPAPGQFIKPAVPKTIQTDRPSKQSIEQMEEAKLKAKFGGLQKPGGSQFLQKRLNKGMKYFDSGDYNMAKQSGKLKMRPISGKQGAAQPQIPNPTGEAIPTPDSIHHRKPSSEISKLAV